MVLDLEMLFCGVTFLIGRVPTSFPIIELRSNNCLLIVLNSYN